MNNSEKKKKEIKKGDKQTDQKSNTEYLLENKGIFNIQGTILTTSFMIKTTCLFYMLQPSADLTKLRANWRADARIIQNASNKKSGYNRLHSLVVKFMRTVGGSSIDSIITFSNLVENVNIDWFLHSRASSALLYGLE